MSDAKKQMEAARVKQEKAEVELSKVKLQILSGATAACNSTQNATQISKPVAAKVNDKNATLADKITHPNITVAPGNKTQNRLVVPSHSPKQTLVVEDLDPASEVVFSSDPIPQTPKKKEVEKKTETSPKTIAVQPKQDLSSVGNIGKSLWDSLKWIIGN